MLSKKQIQSLIEDINIEWVDKEIAMRSGKDYRKVSSSAITHSLLLEVLFELRQLNKTLGGEGLL
jgi:hypothetical protein